MKIRLRPVPVCALFETRHASRSDLSYHRHAAAFVTIVIEGSYVEVLDEVPRRFIAGSVVLHRPCEEHADHFTLGTHCLNVELDRAPEWASPGALTLDAEFTSLTRRLAQHHEAGDHRRCDAVADALRRVVAHTPNARPRPQWLDRALLAFDWAGTEPLLNAARSVDVHPTHFSRDFRRYMGMTPSKYRRGRRINLASKMLLGTESSLAQIALRCGFSDQSHFNHAFTTLLEMSPRSYRRSFGR